MQQNAPETRIAKGRVRLQVGGDGGPPDDDPDPSDSDGDDDDDWEEEGEEEEAEWDPYRDPRDDYID